METYTDLNANEILVLKAISKSSNGNGGDFTYFDDTMKKITEFTKQQVKGYISQLCQKGYIDVDEYQMIYAIKEENLLDFEF